MSAEFIIADVFARAPGEGNQLAVFGDGRGLSDAFMQRAANEIGYSETTFVLPPETDADDARLRIFTPQRELPFAGHPVVGSAVVVAARKIVRGSGDTVRFGTGVGTIEVRVRVESERAGWAEMRQPVPVTRRETTAVADVEEVARALGIDAGRICTDRAPIAMLDNGMTTLITTLDSIETVRKLEPNPSAIVRLTNRFGCVLLAALTTETVDAGASIHCRIFGPVGGVLEDPATGSANGALGVYVTGYGLVAGHEVVTEQGFEMGRPSLLRAKVQRDGKGAVAEVRVSGDVFVTGEGRLFPW